MSKMPSQMSERERETFPSQSEINPRDNRANNNTSNSAQLNVIHILRSGKEVDNQVEVYDHTKSTDPVADPSPSSSSKASDKEVEEVTEPTYDPPAPFPNRIQSKKNTKKLLKSIMKRAHYIPLLEAVEQVPSYAKFLKDLCTKK